MPRKMRRIKRHVKDVLGDDWRSPNDMGRDFEPLGDFPAVYALVIISEDFLDYTMGYIGMTCNLAARFKNHHALKKINRAGRYCQIWFRKTPPKKLRSLERDLIQAHSPILNIQGKVVTL